MIHIAICDDSIVDRKILERILIAMFKVHNLEILVDQFSSGEEFLAQHQPGKYAILFLDIIMGDLNGIETGKRIRKIDTELEIIYCSSSMDFTLASYEVFAFGYLVKPFDATKISALIDYFLQKKPAYQTRYIKVRSNYKEYVIHYKDILYVESEDKRVLFHTTNQGIIPIYEKLSEIQEQLKDVRFLRCHQSYLVNMDHIVKATATDFVLMNNELVPIRKRERKQLLDAYKEYQAGGN